MRLIDADKLMESIRKALGIKSMTKSFLLPAERTIIDQIDSAPTVGGWISVKDRLPETQNPVIVYVPPHTNNECESYIGYVGMAYYTNFGDGFWCGTDGNVYGAIGIIHSPTHWMPLPELPIAMDEQQNRSFADAQDDSRSGASR